ncbi:hypothetical protein MCOR25_010579 [Pyricularia grisea]|nr:hypothetical protein MCOR25_010579 [Pyricularia grisea]
MVLAKILAMAAILALSPAGALANSSGPVGSTSPERPVSPGSFDEHEGDQRPCKVTIEMGVSPGGLFRQLYGSDYATRGGTVNINQYQCTVDVMCKNPSCPGLPARWEVTSFDETKQRETHNQPAGGSVWAVGKKHDL